MASQIFVNGVTLSDGAGWAQDVDNVVYQFLSGVAGTNTITATGPAGLGAYAAGRKFRFIPAATNTGAVTINITGTAALGARSIFAGGVALVGGELRIGVPCEIIDDGTQFELTAAVPSAGIWTPSIGGTATYTLNTGRYMRLGNLAFIEGNVAVNVIGTGSTTVISGFPFTIAAENYYMTCQVAASVTAIVSAIVVANGGTSTFTIRSRTAASASDGTSAIFQNGTSVLFSGCAILA